MRLFPGSEQAEPSLALSEVIKQSSLMLRYMLWNQLVLQCYLGRTWSPSIQGIGAGFVPKVLNTENL